MNSNSSNEQNNGKMNSEGSTSSNKIENSNSNTNNTINISDLIQKKPSIFKRKIKKKVDNGVNNNSKNNNKIKNNEDDELKKISEEIGGNVAGIMKQDELEHNVVNQFIFRSKQNQLLIEEKRLRRAISVANTTSRKIDVNFRKWMNPKTSEREKKKS